MKLIKEPIQINWKKIMTHLLILIVLLIGAFKVYQIGYKVNKSWQEIQFAYEKPQMVKEMRESYQKGVEDLEKSFIPTPTPSATPSVSPSPEPSK